MKLHITHLYPKRMNIYGDRGNILTLSKRASWRGIDVEVTEVEISERLPKRTDLYFFGGGQDQEQIAVAHDLAHHKTKLAEDVANGVALLAVCGGYQLLGHYYEPGAGERLEGVGVFPITTIAGNKRLIGNVVAEAKVKGIVEPIVGFENHSGLTRLSPGAEPLAHITAGFGNNGEDGTEGCKTNNAIGTYLHGSLLPANPALADWLLEAATGKRLEKLDDTLETAANALGASLI